MNKDVIYIDVEDDITAIISKVKASNDKIVALVPPKRIGVLQSAVNLRLLSRAADNSDKRLVIITSNHALMSLAAIANLPVAKNLQTKPELAPIAALDIDDGEDVIDGNDLPIGDHARQAGDDAVDAVAASSSLASAQLASPPKPGESVKPSRAKAGSKVPNFNTFRKKLVIGIIAAVLLIAFLVWALIFAPRATIVVAAKTNDSSVNAKVAVGDKLTTDLTKNTIKAMRVQKIEKKTIDFAATGTKNVGEKATSTVRFTSDSFSALTTGINIPAGTALTSSSGKAYYTDAAATLSVSAGNTKTVGVTAADKGATYNGASGSVSGAPSSVNASLTAPTSGGTDKVVKVVTAEDVQTAKESLVGGEAKDVEGQLKTQLKDATPIAGSYRVEYNDLKSTPDIGAESEGGNAVLNATVVYGLYGLSDSELKKYLDAYLKKQLGNDSDQRVFKNGADKPEFQDVVNSATGAELTLIATAKLGPKLEEDEIKQQSLGRKTGEIQESLQSVQGIEEVEVNYFPFWVTSVPSDEKKVNVQFKVDE